MESDSDVDSNYISSDSEIIIISDPKDREKVKLTDPKIYRFVQILNEGNESPVIFKALPNVYYFYFQDDFIMYYKDKEKEDLFENIKLQDIQIGYLKRSEKHIFTFLGFETSDDLDNAISYIGEKTLNPIQKCRVITTSIFNPKPDIEYIYFNESFEFQQCEIIKKKKFGLQLSCDIQRNCVFDSKDLEKNEQQSNPDYDTFIGFKSLNDIKTTEKNEAFQNVYDGEINFYENEINIKDNGEFKPNQELFYIVFTEIPVPSIKITCSKLLQIENAVEYKRYYSLPKRQGNLYTFVGFKSLDDVRMAMEIPDIREFSLKYGFYLQFYGNDLKYNDFHPTDKLYYIYFKDVNELNSSQKHLNTDLYECPNAKEIWQSYHLPNTKDLYTFIGFDSLIELRKGRQQLSKMNFQLYFYNIDPSLITLNEFVCKPDLYYIFFQENIKNNESYQFTNAKDVQKNRNLPDKEQAFTFLGFDSISAVKSIIDNEQLQSFVVDNIYYYKINRELLLYNDFNCTPGLFYIYFKEVEQSININEVLENAEDVQQKVIYKHKVYTFVGFKSLDDVKSSLSNEQFEIIYPKKSINYYNFESKDLYYDDFHPTDNLFYIYFEYQNELKGSKTFVDAIMFELTSTTEIQQNYHYPGTKKLFTFVGFRWRSSLVFELKNQNFIQFLQNKPIYYYVVDNNYLTFSANEKLLYLCYKDSQSLDSAILFNPQNPQFPNVVEIQQNFYLPSSSEVYTFLGFESSDAVRNYVSLYFQKNNTKNYQEKALKVYNDNIKQFYPVFHPVENFCYVYFKELHPPFKPIQKQNCQIFGLKSVADYQREFYRPRLKDTYTFIGFRTHEERTIALKDASNSIGSITNEINFDDSGYEEFIYNDLFYIYFKNSQHKDHSIIRYHSNKFELKTIVEVQEFFYLPNTRELYTFIGFKSDAAAQKALKNKNLVKEAVDGEINIYSGSILYEFQPRSGLYYLCFKDPQEQQFSRIFVNEQMYGLKNVEEIQQNYYLPESNEIYTFVGFKSPNYVREALANKVFTKIPVGNTLYALMSQDDIKGIFRPEKDLFYIYFKEIHPPSWAIQEENCQLFGFEDAVDCQREFLLFNSKQRFTFVGFRSLEDVRKNVKRMMKAAQGNEIKSYNFSPNEIQFDVFHPTDGLYYIYFTDLNPKIPSEIYRENTLMFGLKNVAEIQRSFTLPITKKACIFIGFRYLSDVQRAIFNDEFIQYLHGEKINYLNFTESDLDYPHYQEFVPNDQLYYIYFAEHKPLPQSYQITNRQIFGLKKAVEINRSYYYPGKRILYTFVGFNSLQDRDLNQNDTFVGSTSYVFKKYPHPEKNF